MPYTIGRGRSLNDPSGQLLRSVARRYERMGCGWTTTIVWKRPGGLRAHRSDKKRIEAGLINWPIGVGACSAQGEKVDHNGQAARADPSDRLEKYECKRKAADEYEASLNDRPKQACNPLLLNNTIADPGDQLNFITPLRVPVMKFDVQNQEDDGKLGFGLLQLTSLKRWKLVIGISHDQLLSARS